VGILSSPRGFPCSRSLRWLCLGLFMGFVDFVLPKGCWFVLLSCFDLLGRYYLLFSVFPSLFPSEFVLAI
jgi:hypothetical protein